jgi:hypothetical protein
MKPTNNSFDDRKYGITYIFPAGHQLSRAEMGAEVVKQREAKSKQLLKTYLLRSKEKLDGKQKRAKAKELLEEHLRRGGTVVIKL